MSSVISIVFCKFLTDDMKKGGKSSNQKKDTLTNCAMLF